MRAARSDERGFLLVGVIVFVLALTILGLSLYELSSYEAVFLGQSRGGNRALYRAQGGLEMVKSVLALPPYQLATADSIVGHEGIVRVNAWQRRTNGTIDSTGYINWGDTVSVYVEAVDGGVHRMLRADYQPQPRNDFYKRLFTVAGTSVATSPGTQPGSVYIDAGFHMVTLGGVGDSCRVWQTSPDQSWTSPPLTWLTPRALRIGSVPLPDLTSYYASPTHAPAAGAPAQLVTGPVIDLRFDAQNATPSGLAYYTTPDNSDSDFSFAWNGDANLWVAGTAVWILPRGVRFVELATVRALRPGTNTLVIVASPEPGRDENASYTSKDVGMIFVGGLDSPDSVNVVLASDGDVDILQVNGATISTALPRLSIYSGALRLRSPGSGTMHLGHDPAMDAAIDFLQANDALPHGLGSTAGGQFTFLKGSWRDLTP